VSELVVLVGLPGSGKTSFYQAHFGATHVQVSKDLLKNARDRQQQQITLIDQALAAGRSVVVDNINAHPLDRAPLLLAGRARQARVVAYYLDTEVRESLARNRARTGKARVPDVALFVARKRLVPPTAAEGFDAVFRVRAAHGSFEVTPSA
jgi:predicted kinase